MVFDVSRKTPYTYDLDNSEKIMIVDVDAPALQTSPTAQFIKSPLVASYAAQAISGGKTRVVLQLRAPVKLITSQALPPNGEKTDRVVLDLAPVTP